MNTKLLPKAALDDLNALRAVAACAVFVGHVRGLVFVDYDQVAHPNILTRALYLVTGLGHQAVIVFFVLSGFFIGTSVTSSASSWSWSRYALRRFTRLYVVLLPALALTTVFDVLGLSLFGADGIYGGHIDAGHLDLPDVRRTLTPRVLAANLGFLQHIFTDAYGSDNPLWSLSYEFWSYVTFPLLYLAARPGGAVARRVVYAVTAASLLVVLGGNMRLYFTIWAFGALVAVAWNRRSWRAGRAGGMVAWLAFSGALIAARLRVLGGQTREDVVLGLATTLLLVVSLGRGAAREGDLVTPMRRRYARVAALVAGFSYTLYAVHYPVITFVEAWWLRGARRQPELGTLAIVALSSVAFIVAFVYPFALATEGRTDAVRRVIERSLERLIPRPKREPPLGSEHTQPTEHVEPARQALLSKRR